MKKKKTVDTEAAFRREALAIAEILSGAAKRMAKLDTLARAADRRNPLPEGDPRAYTYFSEVIGASECWLEDVREAAGGYRATARTTDADLRRMKHEEEARAKQAIEERLARDVAAGRAIRALMRRAQRECDREINSRAVENTGTDRLGLVAATERRRAALAQHTGDK